MASTSRRYEPNWKSYEIDDTSFVQGKYSKKAVDIYSYGLESVVNFHELYEKEKKARGSKGGYSTYLEDDLLRSMLVFSSSTIDSVVKQTIKDMLHHLEKNDDKVKKGFNEYVAQNLSNDEKNKLLTELLLGSSPKDILISKYAEELSGSSLQSKEEIMKTANALGIDLQLSKADLEKLKEVFNARNKIIHELDYNQARTSAKTRNRIQRRREDMIKYSELLLRIAKSFIEKTSESKT